VNALKKGMHPPEFPGVADPQRSAVKFQHGRATNVVKGNRLRNSLNVYDQRKRSPTALTCPRLIIKSKAPGEKLAFHPFMVSHVASPIDPPVVKTTSGWKVARVSPWGGSRATLS